MLPGDKRGDRTDTQIKISTLVTIAIQRKKIQRDADKQKNHEHQDFPDIEDWPFQFDGTLLTV
jgi:hypothetical protein